MIDAALALYGVIAAAFFVWSYPDFVIDGVTDADAAEFASALPGDVSRLHRKVASTVVGLSAIHGIAWPIVVWVYSRPQKGGDL